jgi:nucleotide-binding universal stress UspA family protein
VLKSILAVSEGGSDAAMAYGVAGEIAALFGGAVEAVHYPTMPNTMADGMVGGMSGAVVAWDDERQGLRAAASKAAFDKLFAGKPTARFASLERHDMDDLLVRLRTSDLAVIGRPGVDQDNASPATAMIALHEPACPVIVAPPAAVVGPLDEIVVAWNASQQSANAARLALPLLQKAKKVTVLVVGGNTHPMSTARLKDRLQRQGIAVDQAAIDPGAVSARARGRALLDFTHQRGASMLVMGAYGSNQMLEFLGLGGATGKVISACRVPVFVSH